jgi:hypothetical protein
MICDCGLSFCKSAQELISALHDNSICGGIDRYLGAIFYQFIPKSYFYWFTFGTTDFKMDGYNYENLKLL